jgi:hypothetical protein
VIGSLPGTLRAAGAMAQVTCRLLAERRPRRRDGDW